MTVDPAGFVYWVDLGNTAIHRTTFDGQARETLPIPDTIHPGAIAVDPRQETVYWTDVEAGVIWRSTFPSGTPEIIVEGLGLPAGLAIDTVGNALYWSDAELHRLRRAALDGTSMTELPLKGLANPVAIAIDGPAEHIYWSDVGDDCIHRSTVGGGQLTALVDAGLVSVQGLALDLPAGKMYWSDLGTGVIRRANLDGTAIEDIIATKRPLGIAVVPGGAIIIGSTPPAGAIDARQPSNLDGTEPMGWTTLALAFAQTLDDLDPDDFAVATQPPGLAPDIADVAVEDADVVITFAEPIAAGAWTYVTHLPSGGQVRLGHLPGDVNSDATVSPLDVLALLDHLNGEINLPDYATDIDRAGDVTPLDVLRLLDLLNGADGFEPWNGRSLPE